MKRSTYDFYGKMAQTIADEKRQLIAVSGDKKGKPFTYTIGNQEKGYPELLLIGIADDQSGHLLNLLSDRMLEQRRPYHDGELVTLEGAKFALQIWEATKVAHVQYTVQAGQFYGAEDYRVQQVVVPDDKGRFPTDPVCHRKYRVPVLRKVSSLILDIKAKEAS